MYRPDDTSNLARLARLRQAECFAAVERACRSSLAVPACRRCLAGALEPARRSLGVVLIRAGQRLSGADWKTAGGDPAGSLVAR